MVRQPVTDWRDLVRRWVLVEDSIGVPEFLEEERAAVLREAHAALAEDAQRIARELPPLLNKSGGSDVPCCYGCAVEAGIVMQHYYGGAAVPELPCAGCGKPSRHRAPLKACLSG